MKKVTNYLESVIKKLNIPYVDLAVSKGFDTVYRHVINGDESEKLLMFSMSKPITAVATLIAVQKGLISFSDPVSKYLPFVGNAFLLKNGLKVKPKTEITVYSLITMTSGLDYVLETLEVENAFSSNDLTDTITALKLKFLSPLACEPNTKFLYSLSHDLLGAVIEVASKKRFADFVKDELFTPLEMNSSTFLYVEDGLFDVFNVDISGNIEKHVSPYRWVNSKNYQSGGGGLKSTVNDYLKFSKMLASGGVTESGYVLLKPEIFKLLTTPTIKSVTDNSGFTCIQGDNYDYGYGVRVRNTPTSWGLPVGEFGWDGAAGSYLLVDPINNVSIVIGFNLTNWPLIFDGLHLKIVEKIYKELKLN